MYDEYNFNCRDCVCASCVLRETDSCIEGADYCDECEGEALEYCFYEVVRHD